MANFQYRAKKGPTEVVSGRVEAATLDDAVEKLDQMGLFPIEIKEAKEGEKKDQSSESGVRSSEQKKTKEKKAEKEKQVSQLSTPKLKKSIFGRIKSSDITVFGRQLASLLRSGVPILRALWIISEQSTNPKFRDFLDKAQKDINNGRSLSMVLADYPKQFPPVYVALVRTGEDSGNLQEALLRVSEYRQKQEEIMSRVKTAMAYPALMAFTGIGTIIFMLTYVIPKLTKLFSTMGSHLPLPTKILMQVSDFFQNPWFWLLIGTILFTLFAIIKMRPKETHWAWSVLSLKLPIVKGFIVKSELARFSRTFELLIKSGLPILRALEVASPVLNNSIFKKCLLKAEEDLTGGGSLGKSLRDSGVFPLFMTNLVSVSEESGKMDEAMSEVANFYERETDEAIRIMTSLLEPLMILVMGCIVGFIVIAMMLPMFELNMIVK